MILGTIGTGSTGNCYYLKADNGEILLLDAGIPIMDIKKGINFDVSSLVGCLVSHIHQDHALSAKKLSNFSPVWKPYESEHKKQHTHFGCFDVTCFDVPHSVECRAFLIKVDGLTILYATDFEYIPYNLTKQKINVALVEMNYQQKIMDGLEIDNHIAHTVTGHASDKTTTEFLVQNQKHLQNVILCHYSKSENLNREEALAELKTKLPKYINIQYAIPGEEITLGCPF